MIGRTAHRWVTSSDFYLKRPVLGPNPNLSECQNSFATGCRFKGEIIIIQIHIKGHWFAVRDLHAAIANKVRVVKKDGGGDSGGDGGSDDGGGDGGVGVGGDDDDNGGNGGGGGGGGDDDDDGGGDNDDDGDFKVVTQSS